MADGRWQMADGRWQTADDRRQTTDSDFVCHLQTCKPANLQLANLQLANLQPATLQPATLQPAPADDAHLNDIAEVLSFFVPFHGDDLWSSGFKTGKVQVDDFLTYFTNIQWFSHESARTIIDLED